MSDMGGLRKLNPSSFMWFKGFAEANDWMDFDAGEGLREYNAYHEPDHYCEWAHWYNKWEAEGCPEFEAL